MGQPVVRPYAPLTPAELRVLQLVVDGLGRGAIARRLRVSPRTVQAQLTSLGQKIPGDRPFYQRAALWAAGYPVAYLYIAES